jgi:biopolymer transport protein ExbB
MSFDVIQIIRQMGLFDQIILAVLTLMALASLAVFFERLFFFRRARVGNREFAQHATRLLLADRTGELMEHAKATPHSPLAQLVGAGLSTYHKHKLGAPGRLSAVELARRELQRRAEQLTAEVRRGFGVLASVGSVAPFVGLLGTVLGIIHSFRSVAQEGSGGLGTVSGGISEALLVTAAGLVVAIPAVLAFNYLTTRSEQLLRGLNQARGELLDHLEHAAPAFHKLREVADAVR